MPARCCCTDTQCSLARRGLFPPPPHHTPPSHPPATADVALIQFLRAELCVKHSKVVVFRTWDTQFAPPYRFHGGADYYLNVTNQVEPHPLLYFSVKHVQLVRFPPF